MFCLVDATNSLECNVLCLKEMSELPWLNPGIILKKNDTH